MYVYYSKTEKREKQMSARRKSKPTIDESLHGLEYLQGQFFMASIAKELGISPGSMHQWKQIPEDRVLRISEITGVPPHKLRPDLYQGYAYIVRENRNENLATKSNS